MRGLSGATVAAAIGEAAHRLGAAGGESPRLDAEVLLAHLLGRGRAWLLAHGARALDAATLSAYGDLVVRRARGEPVAYLVGHREWYDLDLRVGPAVLVPRPETEGLLERALSWARARPVHDIVDVGTGSGALAIALTRALPAARVVATDVSPDALDVARENARRAGACVDWRQGDLLEPLSGPVDLIVANLPYIGEEEYAGLAPDVRLFEPRLALVGGAFGHELLARLLAAAPSYLRAGGALMAELGPAQADAAMAATHAAFPAAQPRLERDYAGLTRYLIVCPEDITSAPQCTHG